MTNSRATTRSVSFDPFVRCVVTMHTEDYTDEEISNTWISNNEYEKMKRDIKVTLAMMNQTSVLDFEEGVDYTTRGLETRTATAAAQKASHRFCAIDAVLDEQDRQHLEGINDPVALSSVCAKYSFICQMTAVLMAAADAKIALGYDITGSNKPSYKASTQTKESLSAAPQTFPRLFQISPSPRVSPMAA